MYRYKRGDNADLDEQLTVDGDVLDLTNATSVRFVADSGESATSLTLDVQADIVDADEGRVSVDWAEDDLDISPGDYRAEWVVKWSNGDTQAVPTEGFEQLVIDERLSPQSGTLEVTVTGSDGQAIDYATVSVNGQDRVTDASGVATVPLQPDTYSVTVDTVFDSATVSTTITPDATTSESVSLAIQETGFFDLTVEDDSGADPVADATVSVGPQTATTDDTGQVSVRLEPGDYSATVTGDVNQTTTATYTITSASTTTATHTHPRTFTLTNANSAAADNYLGHDLPDTAAAADSSEPMTFPDPSTDALVIDGRYDPSTDTWTSTNVSWPTITSPGSISYTVTAPNGLDGTLEPENDYITIEGTLKSVAQESGDPTYQWSFDELSPLDSNGPATAERLEGSADFDATGGSLVLVDNVFTIPDDTSDAIVNERANLPFTDEGRGWGRLPLDFQ